MDVINLQALMIQYDLQINDMVVAKQNKWYAKQNQTNVDDISNDDAKLMM